jgi:ubiquinone/menaquinone biosynthesis C-methylase UbiE
MSALKDIAEAQNLAIFGQHYFGQEAFFDYDVLNNLLPADIQALRILEIGAGNAVLACRLARERGARVTCVEIDDARVRIARQNIFLAGLDDSVTVVRGDMDRLATAYLREYDVIVSLDALQHSRDLTGLLERIVGDVMGPRAVAMTIWCCADGNLAERWGFGGAYHFEEVARVLGRLRPSAQVWSDTNFTNRFERYLSFLKSEKSRLIAAIGWGEFTERQDLILLTLDTIGSGRFEQLVMSASGRSRDSHRAVHNDRSTGPAAKWDT